MQGIYGFFHEHRFLSNFAGPGFAVNGLWYPTNEHFYQACKTDDPDWHERIRTASSPGVSKRLGRQAPIKAVWEQIKDEVMWAGLEWKFNPNTNPVVCSQLLATGWNYLEETNNWGDTYWGVCDGIGENRLGIMLMEIRGTLR